MQPSAYTCYKCQAALPAGVIRCPNCGENFPSPVPSGPAQGAPVAPSGYAAQPATKSPLPIILGVVGIGCLGFFVLLAAVLFPVFTKARDAAREAASSSNLKQIGLACISYAQDNNQKFPPMDSMDHFKTAVSPYLVVKDAGTLFVEPGTGTEYILNEKASKVDWTKLPNPSTFLVMREAVPHSDGDLAVLYADGHVSTIPASSASQSDQSGAGAASAP